MATTSPSKRHLGLTSSTLISTSDVTVGGNLIVNGTTTTLNTATLQVEDKNIELNKGGSAASSNLGGITVLRGTSASAQFIWDQGNTRWDISNGLHVDGEIFTKSHGKSSQWATAYGWGDHADGDYLGNTAKAADSEKLDGIDSTDVLHGNANGTNDSVTTDLDGLDKTGFYTSSAFVTKPSSVSNWMYVNHIKLYNSNTGYQKQIGYDTYDDRMWLRTKNNSTWTSWKEVWNSGDFAKADVTKGVTAHGWGNHADAGYVTTDTTYNFAGSTFTSRNSGNAIAINSATSNMTGYTNGSSDAGYADGGLFVAAYNSSWVSQIFSNFRTGEISVRGKNSGTWKDWRFVHDSGHFSTTDVANGVTAHGWGNHADEGYSTTDTNTQLTTAQIAAMGYIKENEDKRYKALRFTGEGGDSGNGVINYGIYQEGGSWSHPYPDLVIGYHTGVKIGGATGYNGTRFYSDAPGRSGAVELMSVGDGNTNVNITNSLTVGGTVTASGGNSGNWNTAHGWGDHANAGYIKTLPSHNHDDRYYTEDESDKLFADIDVESHINTAYVDIQVDGNADTYYPVRIQGRGSYAYQRYSVSRRYSWKAPDTWYTASHKGGLTFTFEWSGDTAWGGNHKSIRVVEFHETYSNMLGGIVLPVTGGIMVWLRGGGAQYRLHTPEGRNAGADIEYEAYTAGNGDVYKPRNAEEAATGRTNEVNSKWPVRYSNDLYDDGNRVATQSWSNSQYLGKTAKAADSEKVDGINGASLLRSDAADSFSGILTGTASTENLKIGGIRGTAKGSQTGEYIHLYNRVHIGGPSGWGAASHGAPNHGLSTWGSADFGMNGSGVLQLNGTTFLTKDRLLQNVTNTNWDAAHGWGNHASAGYIKSFDITAQTDSKYLRSNAADTIGSTLTMGTQVALVANNYGRGVFGLYSSTRYQHVWSMGAAYKTADDGTTLGNLYGLAWTHSNNTQGEDIAGLGHQLLCVSNGDTRSAMGDGFWTKYNITTTSYGTAANWKTAYDWGNHADAGYVKQAAVNSSTVDKANGLAEVGYGSDEGTFYQTSGTFAGHTGWANYWIGNHGNGQTYYNTVDIRPFWGVPRYSRQEGTEGVIKGPFDYWTQENFTPSNYSVKSANETLSGSKTFSNSYNEFGNSTGSVSNDGGWNGRVNVAGSSHARLDVKSVSDGIITTMYAHTGHGAGKIGTMSSHPIQFMTGGTTRGQVNSKGVLHMASDIVGFWDFSDRRLKTNIKPLENNLEKVMSLHPVSYQWKEGDRKGRTNIGLIAQEVEEIVPEVVREQERLEEGSTKTYKTVDYEHLVSVLIGAVKEQQEQINELKSKMCKCNGK